MQKLSCTWHQQKSKSSAVHANFNLKEENGQQKLVTGNQGKRRLGRFPISSTSVIVNKDPAASSIQKQNCFPEKQANEDIPASFLSSFSASIDNDLIMEVEKMEAALSLKKEGNIQANQTVCHKEEPDKLSTCSDHESEIQIPQETRTENIKCASADENLKRSPKGRVSELCGKRKHVKTPQSSRNLIQGKESAKNQQSLKGKSKKILELVSSPVCSPVEKRMKGAVKAVKKATVSVQSKSNGISTVNKSSGLSATKNNLPIEQNENTLTSSLVTSEKVDMSKSFDFSDISFSPLCATPVENEDRCDIVEDDSPQRKSVACRDLKLSPNILKRRSGELKSNKKQFQPGLQKQTPNVISCKSHSDIVDTPVKSGVKNSFSKNKRPSPTSNYSPDALMKKKERKTKNCVEMKRQNIIKTLSPASKNVADSLQLHSHKEEDKSGGLSSKKLLCTVTDNISERESNLLKAQKIEGTDSLQQNSDSKTSNAGYSSSSMDRKDRDKSSVFSLTFGNIDGQKEIATSPTSSGNSSLAEDKRELSSWGLPEPVLEAYKNQGVSVMFQWQAECLLTGNVLDGGNLVYSAPTSAGKTLVAELLLLKRVLETKTKALFILPFVSVAREKMYSLQRLYQDAGIRVGGYMGSHSPPGGLSNVDVAVCTIEKGNSLINRLMEEQRLAELGAVIVDELHMVGDSHRGYLLELMLTKLAYISRSSDKHVQVVGMSATLPNLSLLAKWLNASLYHTQFRPVPLYEHIKVDSKILDCQLLLQREIPAFLTIPDDKDHVIALCLETVTNGHAALVFCPTKNWCEKLCETIARRFYALTHPNGPRKDCKETLPEKIQLPLDRDSLMDTVEQLKRCPAGVDPLLGKCVLNGVAYHHAGLTFDERDIIEGAFRQGHVKILVATSTLSSGVNLPARRVIIRTPMFHGGVLDIMTYKQMSGRAGRKGIDSEGESILICKPHEKTKGQTLLTSGLPPVESCLQFNIEEGLSRSLKRAILEVVVSGVAQTPQDVISYVQCTLLSASLSGPDVQETSDTHKALVESCTKFLQENEFVTVQMAENEDGSMSQKFYPTQLGLAVLASSLSPDEGLSIFAELQKARRAFVLDTELHIIYLVTPVYTSDLSASIDWYHFHTLWETLTPADRRVAELVGVSELFITRAIKGRIGGKTEAQKKSLAVHYRFYTSLVLNSLVQESPLAEVASKFNCNKGQLQSLQQSASTYAGMIAVFCERLGWHNLQLILSQFQKRLSFGVQQELVDLVRISSLNASSARMLYNAGYHTVAAVARADELNVENLFKNAAPFQSEKKQDGETDWEVKERRRARCIWLTGRKGVTELDAALTIIEEAKVIVQGDLGISNIAWGSKDNDCEGESSDEEEKRENNVEEGRENSVGSNLKNCKDVSRPGKSDNDDNLTVDCHPGTRPVSTRARNVDLASHPQSVERKGSHIAGSTCKKFKEQSSMAEDTPRSRRLNKSILKENINRATPESKNTMGAECLSFKKNDLISPVENLRTRADKNNSRILVGSSGHIQSKSGRRNKSFMKRNSSICKGSEKSFFGQIVVSPPSGIREKSLCVEINSRRNASTSSRNTSTSSHSQEKPVENSSVNDADIVSESNSLIHSARQSFETDKNSASEKIHVSSVQTERVIPSPGNRYQSKDNTENFSFSESFVLDTQIIDLIDNEKNCDVEENQLTSEIPENIECKKTSVVNKYKSVCLRSDTKNMENPKSSLDGLKDQILDCVTAMGKDPGRNNTSVCLSPDPFFDSLSEALENDFKYTGANVSQNTGGKSQCVTKTVSGEADLAFSESLFDSAEKMPIHEPGLEFQREKKNILDENTQSGTDVKLLHKSKGLTENAVEREKYYLRTVQDSSLMQKEIQNMTSPEVSKKDNFLSHRVCEMDLSDDKDDGDNIGGSLIAASNYERLDHNDAELMVDESQELNSSYADLHIIPGKRVNTNSSAIKNSNNSDELDHHSYAQTLVDTGNNGDNRGKPDFPQESEPKVGFPNPVDLNLNCQSQFDESSLLAALENDSFSFSSLDNPNPGVKTSKDQISPLPRNSTPCISSNKKESKGNFLSLVQHPVGLGLLSTPVSGFRDEPSNTLRKTNPTNKSTRDEKPDIPCPTNELDEFFADSFSCSFMDKVLPGLENVSQNKPEELNKRGKNVLTSREPCEIEEQNGSCMPNKNKSPLKFNQLTSFSPGDKNILQPPSHNSSKNDGSDCVPPTPPDESINLSSPFKFSFYSPLKSKASKCNDKDETSKQKTKSSTRKKICENFTALKEKNSDTKAKPQPAVTSTGLEKCTICHQSDAMKSSKTEPMSKNLSTNLRKYCCHTRALLNQMNQLEIPYEGNSHPKKSSVQTSNRKAMDSEQRDKTAKIAVSTKNLTSQAIDTDEQDATTSQPLTQQSFTIIDVCANKELFQTFLTEWKTQPYFALSVACEKNQCNRKTSGPCIGGKFVKKNLPSPSKESNHLSGIPIPETESLITGISISWENRDSYFVSFRGQGFEANFDPDDTLAEPPLDEALTLEERVQAVCSVLNSNTGLVKQAVAIYDTKPAYVCLAKTLGITLTDCEDPRVADWLREPGSRQKNLHHMVASYCSEELALLDAVGGVTGYQSMGSDVKNKQSSRLRACTESVLVLKLMHNFHGLLRNDQLLDAFIEVEMPALVTIARMELNGFGVSKCEFESQKTLMTGKLTVLEEVAYQMAGHVFSLTSTDDVAKVLYIELKLPINGDPTHVPHLPRHKGRGKRTTTGSTNKEVLEKLQKFHPLPAVILEWRRLSSALTKSLFALQRSARQCSRLDMSRVFGECQLFTATGRVSMMEPNLQNIPKDFAIDISDFVGGVPTPTKAKAHSTAKEDISKFAMVKGANCQLDKMRTEAVAAPVSMRNIFVPFQGGIILAADYSQLELRIIAHLSGDKKLGNILNSANGDVFKMIAAQMKSLDIEEVTSQHRQQAKQVCYGMLYGIGPKALGEQLELDENEAGMFMETFKSRYPGIRKYLRETVDFCQKNGFVKTMFNRRRYLPSIKHNNPNIRAQAERQAVNTTIQGSAADLVKIAMANIDNQLKEVFPQTCRSHAQASTDTDDSAGAGTFPVSGAFLVLQLHDELIYEVSANQVSEVARLVKHQMETAVKLNVSMPVKVKVGPSWGQLQDYDIV